jgi:hypothetical protein
MVVAGLIVGAAIIDVLADPTSPQLAPDPLACNPLAAEGTPKQPASQRMIGIA